jgi:ABC-type nitrate/sulfonate/bicarbonate transport system substrate-binding protein
MLIMLVACGNAGASGGGAADQIGATTTSATTTASALASTSPAAGSDKVRIALDWTPNSNHAGLYVAQAKGYYAENGLDVEILQAQEGGTGEQLVAAGKLDFSVSYQEGVTQARVEGLPVVSVAAVIQHNDSGFASRKEANITSPKDFEGKKYGSFGSAIEPAVIKGLMDCAGGDFTKVQFVEIGTTDFFVASERGDVDFAWLFQGIQGMEAQERGLDLNMVMNNDLKCIPDYYTPVIITSEKMIAERPDLVKRFVHAISKGYQFAVSNPDETAEILMTAVPELNPNVVKRSQQYLASRYQADAPRWGEQKTEIWRGYAEWMAQRNLIKHMIEPEKAFTNQFLP